MNSKIKELARNAGFTQDEIDSDKLDTFLNLIRMEIYFDIQSRKKDFVTKTNNIKFPSNTIKYNLIDYGVTIIDKIQELIDDYLK